MTFIRNKQTNKQTNMLQSILEVNTYYVWPNLPSGSLISTALHNFRRPHARPHCNTNFRALFSFWLVQCVYIVTCVLVDQKTIWVSLKIGHASNFPVLCHFFLRLNVHVKLYYPYSGESQSIYLTPLPHHFFWAILSPQAWHDRWLPCLAQSGGWGGRALGRLEQWLRSTPVGWFIYILYYMYRPV